MQIHLTSHTAAFQTSCEVCSSGGFATHLDEDPVKRKKAVDQGLIDDDDVLGNVGADELAKAGAESAAPNIEIVARAVLRENVA